ncbi:MAG: hypothetical protein AB7I50_23415 [Vicinamibacterales bacterium]
MQRHRTPGGAYSLSDFVSINSTDTTIHCWLARPADATDGVLIRYSPADTGL